MLQKYVNGAKSTFKPGMRIQLDYDMNDDSDDAPKAGEVGTVQFVDDVGTVHIEWDSGSCLGLIPGEDYFHVVGGV